ncbi:putative membrane protein [Roseovarius nanhaiticus]|uniref:Putative membrane protein n=1 Tax=Roseovarius nanhaiticus TaxID=573024 RepID=A0A1N7GZ09_9RHOB|nr:TIGR01620 family protein [Roseovarius nanhaiticus]SEL19149.1 putative membrane protein [Roseovarius nanhaiticus]SIS17825.1 putative membrane protein [Roseovarius nanhaiticus]
MTRPKGPVLFDLDDSAPRATPSEAPPVPEPDMPDAPRGAAMQTAAALAARRPSRLARVFWGLVGTLLGVAISLAAWDFATGLVARVPMLGYAVTALIAALLLVLIVIAIREMAAFARLGRIDALHRRADAALAGDDLPAARALTDDLVALYKGREDTRWGRTRLAEQRGDQFDASTLLALTEAELLTPLDAAALRQVEGAARQVAAVTALVPLALADVIVALSANIRMIRRIAEIYGGRSGTLGSLRLTRAVMTHLVATGAVAVGDDVISSVAGGSLLSKVSRRFGEGVVNGALTARVGVAAMEVCRPLPFSAGKRPKVRRIITTALSGLFPS